MFIGIHTSIGRGYSGAVIEGENAGAEVIQIFVRQNLSWSKREILEEEITDFKEKLHNSITVKKVVAHSSYLINLASDNDTTIKRSISMLSEELSICQRLGIDVYVMHPGSHKGLGVKKGIDKIIEGLRPVRDKVGDIAVRIAFETTAGSGNQIGSNLSEISEIFERARGIIHPALCIDTAHLFAAGYNIMIDEEYERLISEIQNRIGLKNLLVCHMNDSKVGVGSKKDRHEHIGKGRIDISLFKKILNDKRITNAVAILETPKEFNKDGISMDRINIDILKQLRDG